MRQDAVQKSKFKWLCMSFFSYDNNIVFNVTINLNYAANPTWKLIG